MAECLQRADAQRPFGRVRKAKKNDICVSLAPRYGMLKVWALVPHETPDDRVQPERFTQPVLLWVVMPTCLSLSTYDPFWAFLDPFCLKGFHHYTTGSERLSSPQPLLLLSDITHEHLTGNFFRSETVFFSPFHEASSVISLRRCSTE